MDTQSVANITQLLINWHAGENEALNVLISAVYDDMTRMSHFLMRRESPNHTLQAFGLVHEVYLRLQSMQNIAWQNREHFYRMCAQIMRRVLIDHARAQKAEKRGGNNLAITLDVNLSGESVNIDLVELVNALERLEQKNQLMGQIVNLRFFIGLSIEETANTVNLSPASVKRKWRMAQAWLHQQLQCHH